ncbi:MAG: flagellar hook-basal body protein [Gemmatimonadales bacterium]
MGTSVRPNGIGTAAAALRYLERRQEVVSNNLANVNTDGFKGERAFSRLLEDGQTPAMQTATDLRAGPLATSGAPLDLAITGEGFFVVQTAGGERLTRGGSMRIDDQHRLVDASGQPVLGEADPKGGTNGPVVLPANASAISVDSGGAVTVDGHQIARLRLERVGAGARLQHEANGVFAASSQTERVPTGERTVRQGAREESNVSTIESLVDMISVQRAYASVQKVLSTIDSARGLATTELGKPV